MIPFSDNEEVLFEKLTSYCLGELNQEEHATIQEWIAQNEANYKKYRAVQELLATDNKNQVITVDTNAAWEKVNNIIGAEKKNTKVIRLWRIGAVAAACLVLAAGIYLLGKQETNGAEWISKTGSDTLQLADGTMVIANGKASVMYSGSYNKNNRDVILKGNAFFKVHRNEQLPFTVTFDEGKVTVLGTQFFIDQHTGGFDVRVTEGKVKAALLHSDGSVILTKGNKVHYDKEHNQLMAEPFAEAGLMKYKDEPLSTILKELYLARGISVQTSKDLSDIKLTVDLSQMNSNEKILETLTLLTGGQLRQISATEYRLTKN